MKIISTNLPGVNKRGNATPEVVLKLRQKFDIIPDKHLPDQNGRGGECPQPVMDISQAEKNMQASLHDHHQ